MGHNVEQASSDFFWQHSCTHNYSITITVNSKFCIEDIIQTNFTHSEMLKSTRFLVFQSEESFQNSDQGTFIFRSIVQPSFHHQENNGRKLQKAIRI
jgi:hypothetical protein